VLLHMLFVAVFNEIGAVQVSVLSSACIRRTAVSKQRINTFKVVPSGTCQDNILVDNYNPLGINP
jgi:hypothetical protein